MATDRLVVMGGSEGSTIGARLAAIDSRVTDLIYYSGNPQGRFTSFIREARRKAILGEISHEHEPSFRNHIN